MALIRWEPLREIDGLQKEMNRLFDTLTPVRYGRMADYNFVPAVEIQETDEAVLLKVEVPGINPDDLDIQVSADSVLISGERKSESHAEENGVTRTEFHYGSFQRVIPLSTRIQNTNAQADYKDGILTMTLPKAEEEKNKVVKLKLG